MYLDKGTKGLKELAYIRNSTPSKFQKSIFAQAIDYMINLDNEQITDLDKFLVASGYMQ